MGEGGRDGEKRDGRDPGARTSVGACPEKGLSMKILRAHSADCCARVMAINVTCAMARSTMDGGGAVGKGVWGSKRSTVSVHLPGRSTGLFFARFLSRRAFSSLNPR